MILGVLLGVAAGALWGLIYIAPLLLPEYNPVLIALGRFIAFGVVSLPCLLFFRQELRKFTRADVIEAFRLPFFGNVVFTNGQIVRGDEITIYYGASDEVICGARLSVARILEQLGFPL